MSAAVVEPLEGERMQPTGVVHPVADLFPMMPDEELADLAADIQTNGLLHPIVLDKDGTLIDGRNRLRACQIAGVEPTFTSLNGHEPVALILSSNVNRRHLNAGQRAMAVAMSEPFFAAKNKGDMARHVGVSGARISYALLVAHYLPELAPAVMAGSVALDAAYQQAQQVKDASLSAEAKAKAAASDLDRLRREAPDLADLVVEERMTLADALAAMASRIEEDRKARTAASRNFALALDSIAAVEWDADVIASQLAPQLDASLITPRPDFSPNRIARCAGVLNRVAALLDGLE